MQKEFYQRGEDGLYSIKGHDEIFFQNKKTLRYVVGDHNSEIADYVMALAQLDPMIQLYEKDGKTVLVLKKDRVLQLEGDLLDEEIESAEELAAVFAGDSPRDFLI